jgi:hypothetical protein
MAAAMPAPFPTARQVELEVHEAPERASTPAGAATPVHDAPSSDVMTIGSSPDGSPTATQFEADRQATAWSGPELTVWLVQVLPPLVVTMTEPLKVLLLPTAMQLEAEVHVME